MKTRPRVATVAAVLRAAAPDAETAAKAIDAVLPILRPVDRREPPTKRTRCRRPRR